MKEKPKMYQNKDSKIIKNNQEMYTSFDRKNSEYTFLDVRGKINEIINDNTFISSKLVNITLGNETIQKKIIGVYNDEVITIDNERIPIRDIKDIYI